MLKIHEKDKRIRYLNGVFVYDDDNDNILYKALNSFALEKENYRLTLGYRFRETLDPKDEKVFREYYQCKRKTADKDVITIYDIRNLVIFQMPQEFLRSNFIQFLHTREVYWLWHALIIYFQYYLQLVEFILIRRDEISGDRAQSQSSQSTTIKQYMSDRLAQYRLLIAREYSCIIKGEGIMQRYYHTKLTICNHLHDKQLFEHLLAVSIQVVWIALHRRAFKLIHLEMMRLFASDHFLYDAQPALNFTTQEKALIYGRIYKRTNFCKQTSPLLQELQYVTNENKDILWFAERKYMGHNPSLMALELEYIVHESELCMIGKTRGILGHPKHLYNTQLQLSWNAVRLAGYSLNNDPYMILRQPSFTLPDLEAKKLEAKMRTNDLEEHFYRLKYDLEPLTSEMCAKWLRRESFLIN